jgi:hypothetical protein
MSSSQSSLVCSLLPCPKVYLCAGPPGIPGPGKTGSEGKQGPPGVSGKSDTYHIPNMFGIELTPNTTLGLVNLQLINSLRGSATGTFDDAILTSVPALSIPRFSTVPSGINISAFAFNAFGFNLGSLFSTAPIEVIGNIVPSLRQLYSIAGTGTGPLTFAQILPAGLTISTSTIVPTTILNAPQQISLVQSGIVTGPGAYYGSGTITLVSNTNGIDTYNVDLTVASSSTGTGNAIIFPLALPSVVTGVAGALGTITSGIPLSTGPSQFIQLDFVNITAHGLSVLTSNGIHPSVGPTVSQTNIASSTKNMVIVLTDSQHGIFTQIPIIGGLSGDANFLGVSLPVLIPIPNGEIGAGPQVYQFFAFVGLHESQLVDYTLQLNLSNTSAGVSVTGGTLVLGGANTNVMGVITTSTGSGPVIYTLTFTLPGGQTLVLYISSTQIIGSRFRSANSGSTTTTKSYTVTISASNGTVNTNNLNIVDITVEADPHPNQYLTSSILNLCDSDFQQGPIVVDVDVTTNQ